MNFTPDELARYARHLSLAGFGPVAQEKLKHGSVLVIGAGGLGCPALLYLAAAGVGRIVIVDDDRVDVSNLQRQTLYTTDDAGALIPANLVRCFAFAGSPSDVIEHVEAAFQAGATRVEFNAPYGVAGSPDLLARSVLPAIRGRR